MKTPRLVAQVAQATPALTLDEVIARDLKELVYGG
jgi:hypothetical protein